ncbi:MAG: hypothetical protein NC181_01855 [Clostridium sp.]|nr:hypothetical protein [Clostridium sp.]MCM1444052.1 hypothetical protein [Candidatus Amulumruptor caecigallinarius]
MNCLSLKIKWGIINIEEKKIARLMQNIYSIQKETENYEEYAYYSPDYIYKCYEKLNKKIKKLNLIRQCLSNEK